METYDDPEGQGEAEREEEAAETASKSDSTPPFDEQQRTPESEAAGQASESPAQQEPKP